jgi:molybdopterin-binding protein
MPRKAQGWITFQSSDEERQILEQICQQTQRTKTEILREMIRQIGRSSASESPDVNTPDINIPDVNRIEFSQDLDEDEGEDELLESVDTATLQAIQISARNILKAKIKRIVRGTVNAEVTLAISPDVELVSMVTRASADKLELKKGKEVFAVIKSNSVMIAAK